MSGVFHRVAVTTEAEEAAALVGEAGIRFSFDPAGPRFSYRESRHGDAQLTVARLAVGGTFSTWGDTEVFGAAAVRATRFDWQTPEETGCGAPVLLQPRHPALIVAGEVEATTVYLTPATLQEVAETVYGTEVPVAFASCAPASPSLGRYWAALAALAAETAASGAFTHELVRVQLTRQLAVGMLECFPLTGDPHQRVLSMAAQARRYRRAVRFLDDHAGQPVTVEDAARAAGTTTEALARAFRAHHPQGLTPTQYLRRARLAGAHGDLLTGDPTTGDTVAAIAARWGFAHPGRFAATYRNTYGVPPSTTLNR